MARKRIQQRKHSFKVRLFVKYCILLERLGLRRWGDMTDLKLIFWQKPKGYWNYED
jgi:hypothetical protein